MTLIVAILAVALVVAVVGLWVMRRQVTDLLARCVDSASETIFDDLIKGAFENHRRAMLAEKTPVLANVPWTQRDRDILAGFFKSDTGTRFLQRLQATEGVVAINSAADVMHTAHSAGVAKGYGDCRKHLISLSYSCDEQRENQNANPTVEGEPSRVESEADDYLARVSPKY